MNLKFIGLGSNIALENSLGNHLIQALKAGYKKGFVISAFSSVSAVRGIVKLAKENSLNDLTIVTGIDQKGTSKEALCELLDSGFPVYIFYSSSNAIFHPKIYWFENDKKIETIIGSSNLTTQGLFQNTEASVGFLFDKENDNLNFINSIKDNFDGIFNLSDPNLIPISKELIEELFELKIIPTEAEIRLAFKKEAQEEDNKDRIKELFPKRKRLEIPDSFKKSNETDNNTNTANQELSISSDNEVFVWESSALTERDLNIPSGSNTNRTGSMLFKKGMDKFIDQKHHFRDNVFSHLDWKDDKNKKHIERAKADFRIIVEGQDKGVFNLKLSHNKDVNSKSYLQNNSMTNISWGNAINHIANPNLIGKKLKLYKSGNSFTIKID